ncbi:hypothetical protein [Scytonema sp. PRP1]|uniref:hypothetical protein n=1 Tax=Scytonema sp. PRP1 TaxID=3120513 RepID=UPI002FD0D2AF
MTFLQVVLHRNDNAQDSTAKAYASRRICSMIFIHQESPSALLTHMTVKDPKKLQCWQCVGFFTSH